MTEQISDGVSQRFIIDLGSWNEAPSLRSLRNEFQLPSSMDLKVAALDYLKAGLQASVGFGSRGVPLGPFQGDN